MEPITPLSWEDLPAGVLEIILSKLGNQKQLGPLRLVNSSWRNFINRSLKSLTIEGKHCGGDVESLGRTFTRLAHLTIYSEDEEIFCKLSSIKGLTKLDLVRLPCNRADLRSNGIELLTNLSALDIHARSDFEPNFMETLCTLPNLSCLCICMHWLGAGRSIQQQSIEHLPGMTNLTRLDLHNFRLTSMEFLSGLTNLEVLLLIDRDVGFYPNVSEVSSLVNLKRLQLTGYGIGSSVVENVLTNLKNLTWLGIEDNFLKNGDLATLTRLSKLTHLDLSRNFVNDEGLRLLTGLVSLKNLFLNNTGAKTVIQNLASLTGLEVLHVDATPARETDLMGLSNLVGLKEVSVHDCRIERGELERVSAALPHITFKT